MQHWGMPGCEVMMAGGHEGEPLARPDPGTKRVLVFKSVVPYAMAPHSSTLGWKIPRMEEPGGLQSMGSLGVGHD